MIKYLRHRLNERSTWLLIGGTITAASALPLPWSVFAVIVGVVSALVPDGDLSQ